MLDSEITNIFMAAAADDRAVLEAYVQMQEIRSVREDLAKYARNRKKKADWDKFPRLLACGYHALNLEDEEGEKELSEQIGIAHPLIMRDYMLGVARPSPERAADICGALADCLHVKEADVFAGGVRRLLLARQAQNKAAKLS